MMRPTQLLVQAVISLLCTWRRSSMPGLHWASSSRETERRLPKRLRVLHLRPAEVQLGCSHSDCCRWSPSCMVLPMHMLVWCRVCTRPCRPGLCGAG